MDQHTADASRSSVPLDPETVLVGHSYGGQIISEAGDDAKAKSLAYIAALQPGVGESAGELAGSTPAPSNDIKKTEDGQFLYLDPTNFIKDFYAEVPTCQRAEVPTAQAEVMRASQMMVSVASFSTPVNAVNPT
jgi:pimeloyl-ACP methyl ester carboxylesterase